MTVSLWRIATDTPDYTADDRLGTGAKVSGARWNRVGTAMIYAAPSVALACLETVVHLNAGDFPFNRYLVEIEVPDAQWAARTVMPIDAGTVGWDALPAGKVSLDVGDGWVASRRSLLMEVPSTIVPIERNVLINPLHADASKLIYTKRQRFVYDTRLRK